MQAVKPKIKTKKLPDWEVIMSVKRPGNRARLFSPHAIAAITGREDILGLVAEMKESGKVSAQHCPIVHAPVFYLRQKYDMYGNDPYAWSMIDDFLKKHPYPKVKGFKSGNGHWSGSYGTGTYIPPKNAMKKPFIKEDYPYANSIIKALKKAGYKPAIKPYEIKGT